jgi:hypothetical protein
MNNNINNNNDSKMTDLWFLLMLQNSSYWQNFERIPRVMWDTVVISLTFRINAVNLDSKTCSSMGQKSPNYFKYILRAYGQVVRFSTTVLYRFIIIIIIMVIITIVVICRCNVSRNANVHLLALTRLSIFYAVFDLFYIRCRKNSIFSYL